MSNYVRNFDVKNYLNQTTIPQLIANSMSGCFFLKHGVVTIMILVVIIIIIITFVLRLLLKHKNRCITMLEK